MLFIRYTLLILLLAAGATIAGYFCVFHLRSRQVSATNGENIRRLSPVTDILLSAATVICLFWLVRTGIERRVFGLAELFSLIPEGSPMPGMAAILVFLSVVCFGLGLTAFGRRFFARCNEACQKEWVLWLISAAVVALFFLWATRIAVITFKTNDDTTLMKTIAAIPRKGLVSAAVSFANILFCAFIGFFYKLWPEGYCYTAYHLVMLIASLVIIGRCVLLRTSRCRWPFLAGVSILSLLFVSVFLFPLTNLAFTITPSVVGTAAVALMLCRSEVSHWGYRTILDAIGVLFMLLCFLHRSDSGRCLLCFWALAAVYQAIRIGLNQDLRKRKELLFLGGPTVALLLLLLVCREIDNLEIFYDSDYWNAEYYRSVVMDYMLRNLTTEQLAMAGLPAELSTLLRGWFFLDERINTETFRTITELFTIHTTGLSGIIFSLPAGIAATFQAMTETPLKTALTLLVLVLLLLSAVCFLLRGRRYWPEFLCALCAVGGMFCMCLYLIMSGRFPLRVFVLLVIPAVVTTLMMVLTVPKACSKANKKFSPCLAGSGILLASVAAALSIVIVFQSPRTTEYADRETIFNPQWQTEAYANEHPDTLFISNFITVNLDPFHTGYYPENLLQWGGPGGTAMEDRLYSDAFFRDDVQYMCENPGNIMFLLQYLSLDFGPVQALDVTHLTSNIYVFDFSRITPGEDYTGWYEQNGMTYYFDNGMPVSGTKTIDGVEYEFTAPGAASFMTRFDSEDGDIYTTRAYSLITTES